MTPRLRAHSETVPGVLERAAHHAPAGPALISETGDLSYPELLEAARSAAAALIEAGVRPDEPVGIWLANGADWAIACYGILCAGARVVPVNTRYTVAEAADIIARSRCRIVIAEGDLARAAAEAGARTVLSVPALLGISADGTEVDRRMSLLTPDRISHVQYTSGTTGRPKGALLRHGGLVDTTRSWVRIVGLGPGDRYPVIAPFAHIGGHKTGLLACAVAGAAVLPQPVLDPAALAGAIRERGVTVLQGPPAFFRSLLAEPGVPHGQIRVAVTGAAVVPRELIHDLRERLGVRTVFTAYGLTEAGGVCTMTREGDPPEAVSGTAGRPIHGAEVRIDAPTGPGEILVRGTGLMAGYLDDPVASAAAIVDGWLRTGDLGELTGDGRLRVVDRLTDLVIVGGLNVYPAEVERVLAEHPGVVAAAVVGVAHDRLGEVPAAFVTGTADPAELTGHCAERLAGFKVPRTAWLVAALPLNAAGKVDKKWLRGEAERRIGGQ
ncbi:MAG: AMP-binding protein [Streptosporangiaceae bacterium]